MNGGAIELKKMNKKIIISVALILITIFLLSTNIFAISNPDFYDPSKGNTQTSDKFLGKAGVILGWIQYIGILISIVTLTIIGIKYLFSSVEGKAEYKKTMIPYVIGCFLLVGISVVIELIEYIAKV